MSWKLLSLILLVVVNLGLYVSGDSIRMSDSASADGWSHSCLYYKAIQVYRLTMPVQHKCDFIRARE